MYKRQDQLAACGLCFQNGGGDPGGVIVAGFVIGHLAAVFGQLAHQNGGEFVLDASDVYKRQVHTLIFAQIQRYLMLGGKGRLCCTGVLPDIRRGVASVSYTHLAILSPDGTQIWPLSWLGLSYETLSDAIPFLTPQVRAGLQLAIAGIPALPVDAVQLQSPIPCPAQDVYKRQP